MFNLQIHHLSVGLVLSWSSRGKLKRFLILHDIVNTEGKDHILILGNQKMMCVPETPWKAKHTFC